MADPIIIPVAATTLREIQSRASQQQQLQKEIDLMASVLIAEHYPDIDTVKGYTIGFSSHGLVLTPPADA